MSGWRKWVGIGVAVGIIAGLVPLMNGRVQTLDLKDSLSKIERRIRGGGNREAMPTLSGMDLTRITVHPRRVTTELDKGRLAELTLDPDLQRSAKAAMRRYNIPEAGVVMLEAQTGKVLVYASHVEKGAAFDVNLKAEAPAASVFKVVTGAALIEQAGLNAKTEQCYNGGKSRIEAEELIDDPRRDKWCASLASAMGRSINVVFARLAQKHLTPETLTAMGGALGFGAPVPFVVPNEAPSIEIPADPLEFARSSAGFWHTTLSPLSAAVLAQTVANGGVALQPRIVQSVQRGGEPIWQDKGEPITLRRAIKGQTATELRKMMVQTVASGSAFKAFHDGSGKELIPNVQIAGKTGTLTRYKDERHYTWFVGFAPAEQPEVAVSVLVVNTPIWRIKASELAREVLGKYFERKELLGVARR
jgi:cell division protein FtsI/penicillin-binding protein 2